MIAVTASVTEGRWKQWIEWTQKSDGEGLWCDVHDNSRSNIGPVKSYHSLYLKHRSGEQVIAFLHDDLEILEPWIERVWDEFTDHKVAIVGFGGATGLGVQDIYKTPYDIWQLQRTNYASNQTDWETHGTHETGAKDVAVVDGFAMVVRTSFLDKINGWSGFPFNFHCYDLYLCLMARRLGMKVRMVGVRCTHHGGGTSTSAEYQELLTRMGKTAAEDHREPHDWIYEEFREELPVRV